MSLVRLAQSIVLREQDAEDAVSAAIVKAYQRADSLRYYDNLTVGEIAAVLGIARPSASRRLRQGRERLRDMILAEGGFEA